MPRNFEELRASSKLTPEQLREVDVEVATTVARMKLAEIRRARALTQATLSDILGIDQGDVSKLERRTDAYVSTLRRYIEALGGQLTITASFPEGDPVEISGFGGDESAAEVIQHGKSVMRETLLDPIRHDIARASIGRLAPPGNTQ